MKRSLTIALSAATIGFFVSLAPAVAQVAGNPGDIHDRTVYMLESGRGPDQLAAGPNFGVVPAFLAPGGAPDCGLTQDFNGRYTSVCGM
jgi:hypothetical protein